jgi:crossover junction endodeoxyribonuclease RusA
MHLSAKAVRFHAGVMAAVLAVRGDRKLSGRICVCLEAYPPDRRKRDIDNLVKPTLDALTKAGVWLDDEQVEELTIRRLNVSRGGLLVAEIYERKGGGE